MESFTKERGLSKSQMQRESIARLAMMTNMTNLRFAGGF